MILVVVLVLYLFYLIYRNVVKNVQSYTTIVKDTRQGTTRVPMSESIPYPNDGQYGNEFTYIGWLLLLMVTTSKKNMKLIKDVMLMVNTDVFVKGSNDYLFDNTGAHYPTLQAPDYGYILTKIN